MNLLLVHGLWRTPLSFILLARRLRGLGYGTEHFGYAAVVQGYDDITGRLVKRLERLGDLGPYAVIGHSLGGVLLRSAIPRIVGSAPRHLFMLGTPNRPPRLAHRLAAYWLYRRVMGESGMNLASAAFYATLPLPDIPYTIVAGTAGPQRRWSPFGQEVNDGIVAVSETRIKDDDPLLLLPVTHPFMMNNAAVSAAIHQALRSSD